MREHVEDCGQDFMPRNQLVDVASHVGNGGLWAAR
jgi:hypothetical protein